MRIITIRNAVCDRIGMVDNKKDMTTMNQSVKSKKTNNSSRSNKNNTQITEWIPANARSKSSMWKGSACDKICYCVTGNNCKYPQKRINPYKFCPNCGRQISNRK